MQYLPTRPVLKTRERGNDCLAADEEQPYIRMAASYQHLSPCGSGRALGRRAHYFLNVFAPAIFEYSELPAEL